MSTIATLDTDIAAIKTTASGEVEYQGGVSMQAIITDMRNLLQSRGVPYCPDATAIQELSGTEANIAYLEGSGFFTYSSVLFPTGDIERYNASGGGHWLRKNSLTSKNLTDFSTTAATNGQVPIWNSGQGKYVPGAPTVASLSWTNITGKPIITGTTNPTIAGNLSVGGTLGATGNTVVGGTLNVVGASTLTGNVSMPGALNVGGTTTLTGDVTLDDNLQVNNSISCDGNLTVTSGDTTLADAVVASLTVQALLFLPQWTNGSRPSTSVAGCIGYNTTLDQIEYRGNSAWHQL